MGSEEFTFLLVFYEILSVVVNILLTYSMKYCIIQL